jgi:hypothetical protein
MDRAALIFEGVGNKGVLERVVERVEDVSRASLSLDLVEEATVEVKLGVVERVLVVLAISE